MGGSEIIFEVQESPEGGYEARALGFPIFTQADTLDELKPMVQDAVRCHFEPEAGPREVYVPICRKRFALAMKLALGRCRLSGGR
jgi:hypothetical protein